MYEVCARLADVGEYAYLDDIDPEESDVDTADSVEQHLTSGNASCELLLPKRGCGRPKKQGYH